MSYNSPKIQQKLQQKIIDIYHKETHVNQQIVQLLSIIYEPITRSPCLECFQALGHKDQRGKPYNSKTFKILLDHLLKRHLLVESDDKKLLCYPPLVEIATRDSIRENTFEQFVSIIDTKIPIKRRSWDDHPRYFDSEQQLIREMRIGLYLEDFPFIEEQLNTYKNQLYNSDFSLSKLMELVFTNPFDAQWFCRLPQPLYEESLIHIITQLSRGFNPVDVFFNLLENTCSGVIKESSDALELLLVEQLIFRNRLLEAQQLLNRISVSEERSYLLSLSDGLITFIQGDYPACLSSFHQALKAFKKLTRKRKIYFEHFPGLFFILALIKDQSSPSLSLAQDYILIRLKQANFTSSTRLAYQYLHQLISLLLGDVSLQNHEDYPDLPINYSLESFLTYCCYYWLNPKSAKRRLPPLLNNFFAQTYQSGYYWLAFEIGQFLLHLDPHTSCQPTILQLTPPSDSKPLFQLIQLEEPWQLSLKALINFNSQPTSQVKPSQPSKRLAWFFSLSKNHWSLKPKEQTISKKGVWSQGRPIALKRLARGLAALDYLTPQDLKACTQITVDEYGYYDEPEFSLHEDILIELIGHPLIFWEDSPKTKVELVEATPELLVKKNRKKEITLKLSPPLYQIDSSLVWQETLNLVKVLVITPDYQQLAKIFGPKNKLIVPISAQQQVLAAINTISSLCTVHSDIDGDIADAIEVEAHALPHLQLLPNAQGLSARVVVCPFEEGHSFYHPGTGGSTVITDIDGQRYQTTRDLKKEQDLFDALIRDCPLLSSGDSARGRWDFDDPELCLELLLQLQDLEGQVIIEWPEGESLKVTKAANFSHLHLNVNSQQDWFEVSGQLQLDESLIFDLQQLLTLLEQSPGRFIPLGQGQFLALTDTFRQRLEEFRLFSQPHKQSCQIHPLSTLALQDFFSEVEDLKVDQQWQQHCQKIQEMHQFTPQLPSTFQGDLRDYQLEGFHWLARLSHFSSFLFFFLLLVFCSYSFTFYWYLYNLLIQV